MAAKTYLSQRLKDARKQARLSTEKVGAMVGRSGKAVYAWEAGISEPNPEQLIDLCKVYDVPISFFFPQEVAPSYEYAVIDFSDEQELVDIYRSVSPAGKRALMVSARAIAQEYPKSDSVSEGIA